MFKSHLFLHHYFLIIVTALAASVGFMLIRNPFDPAEADAVFYLSIAHSLSIGHGFFQYASFWPDVPTMGRSPLWPVMISCVLAMFPSLDGNFAMRALAYFLHVLSCPLIYSVTFQITQNRRAALLAGMLAAINLSSLALASEGLSELSFVFFILLGLLFFFKEKSQPKSSAFLFGLATLSRSNFIVFPFVFFAVIFFIRTIMQRKNSTPTYARVFIFILIFLSTPLAWMGRNFAISGVFPLLSTIEGETLYGANNDVVLRDLEQWGSWVFPNEIPGEAIKADLAKTMSEYELNIYYHNKGIAFIKRNWFEMPRLLLGKVIRAYAPVPWNPSVKAYAAYSYRLILYVCCLMLSGYWLRQIDSRYLVMTIAMFITNLFMVLVYYGSWRLAFCFEYFLLPISGAAIVNKLTQMKLKTIPYKNP